MQRANGRQRQNSYRFRPKQRDQKQPAEGSPEPETVQVPTPPPTASSSSDAGRTPCPDASSSSSKAEVKDGCSSSEVASSSTSCVTSAGPSNGQTVTKGKQRQHAGPLPCAYLGSSTSHDDRPPQQQQHQREKGFPDYQPVLYNSNTQVKEKEQRNDSVEPNDDNDGWREQRSQKKERNNGLRGVSKVVVVTKAPAPIIEAGEKQTKKKHNKPTKLERQKKREDAKLTELYKPKDTKVTTIGADLFNLIKSGGSSKSIPPPRISPGVFHFKNPSHPLPKASIVSEFPSLNASGTTKDSDSPKCKSFAAALSTASPQSIQDLTAKENLTGHNVDSSHVGGEKPQTAASANKKRSSRPMTINIEDILQTPKSRNAVAKKQIAKKPRNDYLKTIRENTKLTVGNLLDSSGPVAFNRGKIRERKKKPSRLKKMILLGRQLKKNMVANDTAIPDSPLIPQDLPSSATEPLAGESKSSALDSISDLKSALPEAEPDQSSHPEPPSTESKSSALDTIQDLKFALPEAEPDQSSNPEPPSIESKSSALDTIQDLKFALSEAVPDSLIPVQSESKIEETISPVVTPMPTSTDPKDNIFKSMLDAAEAEAEFEKEKTVADAAPQVSEEEKVDVVPEKVLAVVKLEMHSRKFRSYCDMFVTKELHGFVIALMQELHRLQDRIYKTDPIKLQTKRRYVNGLKEVLNALKLKKVQMVILAPDIEPNNAQGGLDDRISNIILLAKEQKVPYLFSGNRFILGKCIKQTKTPVSVMAVLDKQSVEEQFQKVVIESGSLREKYQSEFSRRVHKIIEETSQ